MDDLLPDLTLAFNETFQMLSISTVLAIIGGLPLGFLIFVTDRHLFWQNRFVYLLSSVLVNIIRSVPFVILSRSQWRQSPSMPVWLIARYVTSIKGLLKQRKRLVPARCASSAPFCYLKRARVCCVG